MAGTMKQTLRDIFKETGHPIPEGFKLALDLGAGFVLVKLDGQISHWAAYEDGYKWTSLGMPVEPYATQFLRAPDMSNFPANDCAAALVHFHVIG